jgi:hypothetical protein
VHLPLLREAIDDESCDAAFADGAGGDGGRAGHARCLCLAVDYEQLDRHPSLRRILLRPYFDKPLPPEAAGLQRVQAL